MTNVDTVDTTKLWTMIKDIRYGMFTARHGNGHLRSRPMTTQNGSRDRGAVLWFFMSRSSDSVADLLAAPEVNVAYADPGNDAYVSVSGKAGVIEDVGKKRELWSPLSQAWFAGGPVDPDLALVAVAITHAEYWDMESNKAVQLFKIARAAVTGAPPTDLGEHGKVRMGR
ncbi:MAG: general stress protein [Alphaproteobacteria bacterium RIFCSPHIGHO2_12_FULL_66_14]|jgi:general stress protein 26|nr:MAG: general stress protein [Alphaproteobacteria bacterium RIFCSPHIGHO2_12_FULL_66_14]